MLFKNEFYAKDAFGDICLVDPRGNLLNKKAKGGVKKLVYGVGVNDWQYVVSGECGESLAYRTWKSMLRRCYSPIFKLKRPTYAEVVVSNEWHIFSAFLVDTIRFMKKGWVLEKDILVHQNTMYKKENCLFTPIWLNSLLLDSAKARGSFPQGVRKNGSNYEAQYKHNGKKKSIGTYKTIEDASNAYVKAKISYIESKREEIETVGKHNELVFSLTDRVIANFKKQVILSDNDAGF